jgi:cobalt-zinc-cadmium efflux system outer membrane protein
MIKRLLSLMVILIGFCISGCGGTSEEVVFPQRRSLGQEYDAFEAPSKPKAVMEAPVIAEANGIITLRKALVLALMHNPELKTYSWDVRISQARQLQATLLPNPKLKVEMEEVGGTGDRSGFDAAETTIQLTQLIELGDKRSKRTKLASLDKELAEWDYEAMRLDVFTEVAKAYVEVLAEQQRLALTEELVHLSEELHDTVAKRVEAGKDSPVEQTKAGVTLSNTWIQHRLASQNLEFARKQLSSMWAAKEPTFESVAGELDSPMAIPTIEELTESLEQNPDVARWSLEIDKAKAALELEKAKSISNVIIGGGLQRFNETDENAMVLNITIPLTVVDRNQAGRLEATYALVKAREQQRAAINKTEVELGKAYNELAGAFVEATELENNVLQGAQSVFEASKTGYTEGKLDYLNVLDAQRTLFEVKARYIEALASYHSAKTAVERLIGRAIDSETVSKSED